MLNFIASGFYPWAQIHFGFTNIWILIWYISRNFMEMFPKKISFTPGTCSQNLVQKGFLPNFSPPFGVEVRCGYTLPRPRKKIWATRLGTETFSWKKPWKRSNAKPGRTERTWEVNVEVSLTRR